jgi:hypothetical protein
MKYINSVNYFKTQLILLTNELQLRKNMNLTHNTIIKADTRNNVKYIVKHIQMQIKCQI